MTAILITPPPVPVEVTAEQVVAYMLRPGSGWVEDACNTRRGAFRGFSLGHEWCGVPYRDRSAIGRRRLLTAVDDIARAENRPAEQVVADIVGPAVGTVGAACAGGGVMATIEGAPFQVDNRVQVVSLSDDMGDPSRLRKIGRVVGFDFTECGASYPADPMILLRFRDGKEDHFWKEELE